MDYPDGPNLLTQAFKNRELPLDGDKGSTAEDKVREMIERVRRTPLSITDLKLGVGEV